VALSKVIDRAFVKIITPQTSNLFKLGNVGVGNAQFNVIDEMSRSNSLVISTVDSGSILRTLTYREQLEGAVNDFS